ncbi:hypothetical protein [Streptomyces rochei]|uniref:hypothetical protein n=1 Tax=Streptomyces rochei TaxID=1928 RepID=UPI00367870C9
MVATTEALASTMAEGPTSHTQNQAAGLAALRIAFPSEQIQHLPKIWCGECSKSRTKVCENPRHAKRECKACGNYITSAHVDLDYVGHAELTNRLLDADPLWDWEPVAFDQRGLPQFDENGGLWIRLTVCGKTRLGYGDAQGKKGPNAVKEAIGDALRNAAMRFGAALDLWAKSDLREAQSEHPKAAEDDGYVSERPAPARHEQSTPARPAEPAGEGKEVVLDRLYLQAIDGRFNPLVLTQVRGAAAKEGVLEFGVEGPPPERRRMPFRELLDLLETAVKQQQKAAQGGDTERSAA